MKTQQDISTQITLKVVPTVVYDAFKKLLKEKGDLRVRPTDVTLELVNSRMLQDIPPNFSANQLKRYSNKTGHSSKEETVEVTKTVGSSWSVSEANTTSVGVEISYKGVFPDVGELGGKITTSFTRKEEKTTTGKTEDTIKTIDKITIAPGDSFASMIVIRSKSFRNSDMESTYKVLDMTFSGVRIPFPKEELIPQGEFISISKVTGDFSDAAFALTPIEGNMTDREILNQAVEDLGWG